MSDYDNTNRGALFKNNDRAGEQDPDYRGNINVDGAEFWLSAWLKTSKNGMKYMSLSIKPKEAPTPDKSKPRAKDFDDQIPF
jgi:uncharacterized protein (DUF736 family)